MRKVQILMSTYNGEKVVKKQIESIMTQQNVDINLLIRDDGSTDKTIYILEQLKEVYGEKIEIIKENNVGWKKSFMKLLFMTGKYDYYGFSDQDDIWLSNKVSSEIELAENDNYEGAKLVHCRSIAVDEKFNVLKEQENRNEQPENHKSALIMECFQGCGMLWNADAMKLLKKYNPQNGNLAHDFWVGLICYYFGKIYFCNMPLFYHIRYRSNSSTDGSIWKGRKKRLLNLFYNKNAYMNPAKDLLEGYHTLLNESDQKFIIKVVNYKKKFKYKLSLILDPHFRRKSKMSSLLFKFSLLLNYF